jgi:hypothetical protein
LVALEWGARDGHVGETRKRAQSPSPGPKRKALKGQNELAKRRGIAFEGAGIPAIDPEKEQGRGQVKGKGKITREPAKSQQGQRKAKAKVKAKTKAKSKGKVRGGN